MLIFYRLPEEEDDVQTTRCTSALASSRAAYEKLRQRAVVLKVARDQGWHVARELASLQDQDEDPLLKKAIKNAARRLLHIFFVLFLKTNLTALNRFYSTSIY